MVGVTSLVSYKKKGNADGVSGCLRVKQLVTSRTETRRKSVSFHFSESRSQDWVMHGCQFPRPQQFQSSKFQGLVNLVRSGQKDSKDEWLLRESGNGKGDKERINSTHTNTQQNEASDCGSIRPLPHSSASESLTQFHLHSQNDRCHVSLC